MTPLAPRPRALAFFAALLVAAPSAAAQDPGREAALRRLEDLRARLEQLQQEGNREEATKVLEQARALKRELAHAGEQAGPARQRPDLDAIQEGLERGMQALRALGRHEELAALERVARDVRREREGARREPAERPRDEHPEIRAGREQLAVFRIAREGLDAAGRGDSAELMQLAVRALELRLEGVRGEEAEAIQRQAPNHAQITELLALAARVLREQGKVDRAGTVGRMAEQFGERYRRAERAPAEASPREAGDEVKGEVERLRRDLDRLRAELEAMQRRMEQLRRSITR